MALDQQEDRHREYQYYHNCIDKWQCYKPRRNIYSMVWSEQAEIKDHHRPPCYYHHYKYIFQSYRLHSFHRYLARLIVDHYKLYLNYHYYIHSDQNYIFRKVNHVLVLILKDRNKSYRFYYHYTDRLRYCIDRRIFLQLVFCLRKYQRFFLCIVNECMDYHRQKERWDIFQDQILE